MTIPETKDKRGVDFRKTQAEVEALKDHVKLLMKQIDMIKAEISILNCKVDEACKPRTLLIR